MQFFECKFRIPFHEVDQAGIMFYAHLFVHAHDVYEQFMKTIGYGLDAILADGRYLIPLVHAQADFREPMRHAAEITARLWLEQVNDSSFTVGYDFIAASGRLYAHAQTVHCCLDKSSGRKRSIPEDLRERLLPYVI
ncbi:MAG: thioesterase family protein [Gammaproteobacteria bacterium]